MSNVLTVERKLNPRQMSFVDHIIAGESEVNAYKLAGYAGEPHTLYSASSRLLAKVNVQAEIAKRQKESAQAKGITLDQIVSGLHDNAVNAASEKQYSASNQAWGLIGKALGLIIERSESRTYSLNGDLTEALKDLTVDELRAMIARSPALELPEAPESEPRVLEAEGNQTPEG